MSFKVPDGFNLLPSSALKPKKSLEDVFDKPNQVHRDTFQNSISAGLAATTREEASAHYDNALAAQRNISDRYAKNAVNKEMLEDLVKLKKHILSLEDTAPKHEDLDRWYAENKNDFLLDAYQDKPKPNLGNMQAGRNRKPSGKSSQEIARKKPKETETTVTVTRGEDKHPLAELTRKAEQSIASLRAEPGSAAGYVRNINNLGKMINELNIAIKEHSGTVNENHLMQTRDRLYGAVGRQMRGLYQNHTLNDVTTALKEVEQDGLVGDSEYYRHPTVDELNPNPKPRSV